MASATHEKCLESLKIIRAQTQMQPKIGIVCGSGLGKIGDIITDSISFNYQDLPGFHVSKVAGHKSKLILGKLNNSDINNNNSNIEVVCMQGRFHGYEGIGYDACAFPIRVMKLLGIKYLIVTNAAGAVNTNYKEGDFMILKDHLPMALYAGNGPLIGNNDENFGPRFYPTNDMFDKDLIKLVYQCAEDLTDFDMKTMHSGIYTMMPGPNYESIAEIKMIRGLGGDVVGMSTSPECLVAHHTGIKIIGISMVTNVCIDDYENRQVPNHEEVVETAKQRSSDMVRLVERIVQKLE